MGFVRTYAITGAAVALLLATLASAPVVAGVIATRSTALPAPLPAAAHVAARVAEPAKPLDPVAVTKARTGSAAFNEPQPSSLAERRAADEQHRAEVILATLAEANPELGAYHGQRPARVRIDDTPLGYQAVAYYRVGEIVVSPSHTADLETILTHEAGHVIDWRDDGEIDWGEQPLRP